MWLKVIISGKKGERKRIIIILDRSRLAEYSLFLFEDLRASPTSCQGKKHSMERLEQIGRTKLIGPL